METQKNNGRNSYKIYDNSDLGEVKINEEVIAIIAAMASMEVEGVVAMAGNITAEIVSKLGMKKLSKGVNIEVADGKILVDVAIVLKMNENILKISKKVQDKVKTTVENMTGMEVSNVNVNISSVATN